MALDLQDMSLTRHAVALSGLNAALRTLINNLIAETNTAVYFGKTTDYFFNHPYNADPATNGGKLDVSATVRIYYQPATDREYGMGEVLDNAGCLSGRRRLALRTDSRGKASFWMTNHPKQSPGLRTNEYDKFTPIDPGR